MKIGKNLNSLKISPKHFEVGNIKFEMSQYFEIGTKYAAFSFKALVPYAYDINAIWSLKTWI